MVDELDPGRGDEVGDLGGREPATPEEGVDLAVLAIKAGNFALRLASNKVPRVQVDGLEARAQTMLAEPISETTRATIAKATDASQMAALTLGSPEFQRR